MTRRGLPKQLEDETTAAIRAIFLKYLDMKKKHMSFYRIIGIMDQGFKKAISKK